MADFLPASDGKLCGWASNFSQAISAAPAEYGLTPANAQEIAQVVQEYSLAFTRAGSRTSASRSRTDVMARNASRRAMSAVLRRYARVIKANPSVSAARKAELGLKDGAAGDAGGRRSLPVPESRPMIIIVSAGPLQHMLYVKDAVDDQRRARPADVVGLQLFCHVGEAAPADPQDARFECFTTRRQYVVNFKPSQAGRRAFYFARWQNAMGATGPWSLVTSLTIPA